MVRFGQAALIVRPWEWDGQRVAHDEVPITVQEGLANLLAGDTLRHASAPLGDLVLWASRRTEKTSISTDAQLCLGEPFNRVLARETLQMFVEMGLSANATILARLVPSSTGIALVLSHGTALAIVMGLDGADAGDQPMPEAHP
jgi:hypothetical protein